MRTETINIYKLDELSETAKQKAHSDYLSKYFDYNWTDEIKDTAKAFEKIFPIKITNWSFDSQSADYTFEMTCSDDIETLRGVRLASYIWNNYKSDLYKGKYYHSYKTGKSRRSRIILDTDCVLTGICFDYAILQPVYDFLNKPTTINFYDLMQECFANFEKAIVAELRSQESFEYFEDACLGNDYEFTADGEMF